MNEQEITKLLSTIELKAKAFLLQKAESAYFEKHTYERALTKEQKRKINCCLNCEKDEAECNGDCELVRTKRRKK